MDCVANSRQNKDKLKECRKILKYYEYCLIKRDVELKENKNNNSQYYKN